MIEEQIRVRRARRPRVVSLWRGARGLGLGVAGGADDAAGGGGVFVSHIAVGGAAHHDGRLTLGDRILAVRDEDVSSTDRNSPRCDHRVRCGMGPLIVFDVQGTETALVGATHAAAVRALRNAGERVTLVVLPAAGPPAARTHLLHSTRTQATSCSTLHELLEDEPSEIPRCVRMVRLVRSGSRLGMDIVGGLGGDVEGEAGEVGVGKMPAVFLCRASPREYSGNSVTIAAQYQPEQYERLRSRIRAINAAAHSPHPRTPHPHTAREPHVIYPR
ncbi:Disks large homolog 1 [Eumeta japonica]|uniref:Disks large homolog 1 n=1 Tax=Eumeta variegata TaxID=151549 RepID=A0A4C1YHY2_EUMVA|nr:Disks large homolog 1 [Eumeta japonica]